MKLNNFTKTMLQCLVKLVPAKRAVVFPMGAFYVGIVKYVIVKTVAMLTTGLSIPPEVVLFLGIKIYNKFAAFSAFTLRSSSLVQSKRVKVTLYCMLLDILMNILTVFTIRCLAMEWTTS